MSYQYRGCRVMAALPYAFNDFGHMAGMSRNLSFDDIDMVIDCLNAGNPEVPNFHAIVLAFSETFGYDLVGKPSSINDHDLGLITLSPDTWQIPDVIAFLHAVFNSTPGSATVPDSILHHMLGQCRAVKKPQRSRILKAAADLQQKAYAPAISNSKWAQLQPAKRQQASASASPPPRATNVPRDFPRFFVFVQSIALRSILLIDGNHIIPLARITEYSPPGVLCDKVTKAIDSLRKAAGSDIESCVFGLSTRTP